MPVEVSDPTDRDIESLTRIYSSPGFCDTRESATWFVNSFRDYHHIKVARVDDAIIGAVLWRLDSEWHHGIAVVEDLWIEEANRRRGLGEELLRACIRDAEQFLQARGYSLRKVLLTTAEDNGPARGLYEKLGFKNSASLEGLYGEGENELVYVLTVIPSGAR